MDFWKQREVDKSLLYCSLQIELIRTWVGDEVTRPVLSLGAHVGERKLSSGTGPLLGCLCDRGHPYTI